MNPFSLTHKLKPKTLLSSPLRFRLFCASSQRLEHPSELIQPPNGKPNCISKAKTEVLKENWLSSLSGPPLGTNGSLSNDGIDRTIGGSEWVIGVDPDLSGALALLKFDHSGCASAEVFDSPFVQVPVGKRLRRRLDARSLVQLLKSFDAPTGTFAYVEQSIPFPRDGKQGWWSGGFGYGLWIGVLVASGFSVVPVPSVVWKKDFELASSRSSKDDSRELAAQLFPNLSPMLKRKKDHGRAEAVLIAAYGKGHKLKPDESCTPDMVDKLGLELECQMKINGTGSYAQGKIHMEGTTKCVELHR